MSTTLSIRTVVPVALALAWSSLTLAATVVQGTVNRAATSSAAAVVKAAAPATTATPASATGSGASTASAPAARRSIGDWVSCNGTTDDTGGATAAFAAARNGAFTLVVDCPVRLHSGTAIDRGIFIDSGTTVEFTGNGKFTVDNLFHPAFVIANSSHIALINWNVEWDGTIPINQNIGGYEFKGKWVPTPGQTQPAGAFNDLVLTPWLTANRQVIFNETQGYVKAIWIGGINPAGVFFLTGDTSNVVMSGLKLYVPPGMDTQHFIPMAISVGPNWKSHQTVTGRTPQSAEYTAVPHEVTFSGLYLDGILMGWQGSVQDALFENITAHRYGDLQEPNNTNVGGIGKWFPPPHLFYLNTHVTDPALYNTNVHFSHIVDDGVRAGIARDRPGNTGSGFANSLKLGCNDCSVDGYTSHRPDGFMDILDSNNLTVSNVVATFDSQFLNNEYPAGMRYTQTSYKHVTFDTVTLTDTAETTSHGPLGNTTSSGNEDIVYSNFHVVLNKWSGSDLPLPTISGATNNLAVDFTMTAQAAKGVYFLKGPLWASMKGTPAMLHTGGSATLTWTSREARGCTASGAWNGNLSGSGSRSIKVDSAGNHDFTLSCYGASESSGSTLRVVAN